MEKYTHEPDSGGSAVTPEELDRERLVTYLDWAEVRAPVWYWPTFAAGAGTMIAGYGLGRLWMSIGAGLILLVSLWGSGIMASRGGVSMPRFRGMPPELKRSYIPLGMFAVVFVTALVTGAVMDPMPNAIPIGMGIGLLAGICGPWASWLYRASAADLAIRSGIER